MVMVIDPTLATSFQTTGDGLCLCQTNKTASFHFSITGKINRSFAHLKITGNMMTLGITVFLFEFFVYSITNKETVYSHLKCYFHLLWNYIVTCIY